MKFFLSPAFVVTAMFILRLHTVCAQEIVADYHAVLKGRPLLTAALCPDGDYLAGGSIDFFGDDLSGTVIKITPQGQRASGFRKIVTDGNIYHLLALSDGKFLACGRFTKVNGQPSGTLVRFHADGSVDETFNTNSTADIRTFNVQSSGKIIITGSFTNYMGKGYHELARLNPDGSLDETFVNTSAGWGHQIIINANDEILVQRVYSMVKLHADGSVDASFNANLGATTSIGDVEALPDGKWLVAARDYTANTNELFRLHADGAVDESFSDVQPPHQILTVTRLANGGIVMAGVFSSYNDQPAGVVLFHSDGTFDKILATMDVNSTHNVFEDQSGGLVLTGEFKSVNNVTNYHIARLKADHSVDLEFKPEITRSTGGRDIGVQANGKLIVGGTSDLIGSADVRTRVLRLSANGLVDPSFVPEINPFSHIICLEVQPDDKILIGGLSVSAEPYTGFARLLPDGSLDRNFNIGLGPQIGSSATRPEVVRYRNSRIYLGGNFTHFDGAPYPHFVVLDEDGKVTGPANNSLPVGSIISDIEIQSDGKVLLMGFFPFEGESPAPRLIRLLEDGRVDASFPRVPVPSGFLKDMDIDSNDRIIVIGGFQEFNGTPAMNIIRLKNDGTPDETFDVGASVPQDVDNTMHAVKVLPTDVIVIAGSFEFYDNQSSPGIVFLQPGGEKIPFASNISPLSDVGPIAFRNNTLYGSGRIIFGEGENVTSAIKIRFDFPVSTMPRISSEAGNSIPVYPNPFKDRIYIEPPPGYGDTCVELYSPTGKLLRTAQSRYGDPLMLQVNDIAGGLFVVRLQMANGDVKNIRLMKQ